MGLTAFEYQCGRGVRCGEETALKIGAAAKQHGIQTVSYTHLDVYKRQRFSRRSSVWTA